MDDFGGKTPPFSETSNWPLITNHLQEQNEDVSEVERRGAARGLAEVLLARRDLLPGTGVNNSERKDLRWYSSL